MTTVDLYPYLIIIGGSILAATAWLLYRARIQTRQAQELVKLNESLNFDLPNFLRQCWPILRVGGFVGLRWRLEWFGTSISGENGAVTEASLHHVFDIQEITLDINLYHQTRGWEQRYFSRMLADSFFLLLRMNIWIKVGATRGTFDQTAKMTVFLQHDMKNLVQLVNLAADQLEDRQEGKDEKLIASLSKSIPAIRDRANYVLNSIAVSRGNRRRSSILISGALKNTAALFEVDINIQGDATVNTSEEALQSILENIVGNYAGQTTKDKTALLDLEAKVSQSEETITIEIQDVNGKPVLMPERLFEPFWSNKGSGRGIGLYQSRQLANAQGGQLIAEAKINSPLKFILQLPIQNENSRKIVS